MAAAFFPPLSDHLRRTFLVPDLHEKQLQQCAMPWYCFWSNNVCEAVPSWDGQRQQNLRPSFADKCSKPLFRYLSTTLNNCINRWWVGAILFSVKVANKSLSMRCNQVERRKIKTEAPHRKILVRLLSLSVLNASEPPQCTILQKWLLRSLKVCLYKHRHNYGL